MPHESSPFPAKKVAEALGDGRMTKEEKRRYLESQQERLHLNADFVTKETYVDLFKRLDLEGKKVANVGAGYSISAMDFEGVSPVTSALSTLGPSMTYIPVDYNHDRTLSWLLLDTTDRRKNDRIRLEPLTADATKLPFQDESLDGYISTNLINEPREDELESAFVRRLIREAYRVLTPGGFLILSSFGYVWSRTAEGVVTYNNDIDIEEIVPVELIEKILTENGFVSIEPLSLNPAGIKDAIKRRLDRFPEAVEAGVQDACAFLAFKPMQT